MTRRERQIGNQKYCAKVAQIIKDLHYFAHDVHIVVQLGDPSIRRFRVTSGHIRHRMRGRGLLLIVQNDWIEDIYKKGMVFVKDRNDRTILVLAANDLPSDGDMRVTKIEYASHNNTGGVFCDHGYVVTFGGKMWFHESSHEEAFQIACREVERNISGEPDLPFEGKDTHTIGVPAVNQSAFKVHTFMDMKRLNSDGNVK